jgi:hypothetical protein
MEHHKIMKKYTVEIPKKKQKERGKLFLLNYSFIIAAKYDARRESFNSGLYAKAKKLR